MKCENCGHEIRKYKGEWYHFIDDKYDEEISLKRVCEEGVINPKAKKNECIYKACGCTKPKPNIGVIK